MAVSGYSTHIFQLSHIFNQMTLFVVGFFSLLTWAALVAPLEGVHVEHVHAVLHAPVLTRRMLTHLS